MGAWKERGRLAVSILFCALAVILGTLLYPVILLFFSLLALFCPIAGRNLSDGGDSRRPSSEGSGA